MNLRALSQAIKNYVKQLPPWVIDLFWPTEEPPSIEYVQEQVEKKQIRQKMDEERISKLSGKDVSELKDILKGCQDFMEKENKRKESVESRLSSIIALTSVAAGVPLAFLTFQSTKGLYLISSFSGLFVSLLGLYIVIQLLRAILAALKGLKRLAYLEFTSSEHLPLVDEGQNQHLIRQIQKYIECAYDHIELNNKKVTQMAIAHRAMENYLWGVLALIIIIMVFGM